MPVKRKVSPAKNKDNKAPASPSKDSPSPTADITLLRSATCHSLSLKSILKYELGTDPEGSIWLRLAGNSGSGFFSDEWISWTVIEESLKATSPITSYALHQIFKGKSANNAGFLTAVLFKEGIVETLPEKRRHYRLTGKAPSRTQIEAPTPKPLPGAKPRKKA